MGLRSLHLRGQEGRGRRRWLREDKKWSQRFELSGLELLILGQPPKVVDSKQTKTFSCSLLWCHSPTSPKFKSSLKKVANFAHVLRFNFGIWI